MLIPTPAQSLERWLQPFLKHSNSLKTIYIMGFFNQFISAAVRQVGRDGGKIISNKIYGNAHTSKVVITNENMQFNSSKDVYSYAEQGFEEGDYVYSGKQYFKLLFGHWLWLLIFVPIPFLGLIGSLVFVYKTFIVKHYQTATPLYWKTIEIKDSRKKEGYREMTILTPNNSKQEVYQLEIPKVNKIYSIVALVISLTTTLLVIYFKYK
jgi:hypothetical protein